MNHCAFFNRVMCVKMLIGAVIWVIEHLVTLICVMSVSICCSFIINADDFGFYLCHHPTPHVRCSEIACPSAFVLWKIFWL